MAIPWRRKMFKKLQRKFCCLVSLMTFVILASVFLILNFSMRSNVYFKARENLAEIRRNMNDLAFPGPMNRPNHGIPPRYVLVLTDQDSIRQIVTKEDFPLDRERIEKVSLKVIQDKKDFGSVDCFFFSYEKEQILLVDGTADFDSLNKTLQISSIVCSVSFVLISLFAILISFWVIKPYEKLYQKEKSFITNASHELKTPLSIIQTNNEILLENDPKNKWVKENLVQTKRMHKLILELITSSKIEELQGKVEMEKVSASDLLLDVIVPYEPVFSSKGLVLKRDIENDVFLIGNEEYIMKLFQVFIDNGLKYTSEKGCFEAKLKKEGKSILISFSNTTSIDSDTNLNEIFDRFYSLEPSKSKKNSGFGIGLSIAKSIIDIHHGKVSVDIKDGIISFRIVFKAA